MNCPLHPACNCALSQIRPRHLSEHAVMVLWACPVGHAEIGGPGSRPLCLRCHSVMTPLRWGTWRPPAATAGIPAEGS